MMLRLRRKNLLSLNAKCRVKMQRYLRQYDFSTANDNVGINNRGIHNYLCAQVRWFKDGSEIRKGKKYEIIAKGLQRILIISKSVFDDEAEYECDARTSKSSGMLTVVGKFCFSNYFTDNDKI